MANKITCTCGHSWNKSDSSKKDATVCHICGKNNMKNGGWLDAYDVPQAENGIEGTMGGLTDVGFNYNGAWGGTMQMGGSMPGAVGFTYARTGAPSKGPRRNQTDVTDASAQNGKEMKFYQEGLDWKPRNISRDGSEIPVDPMGYWNPDNVGEPVIIPSNEITMEGVYQPLLGISDTGDTQMMYPGEDYTFDGESVTEYPMAQKGISVPAPTTADSLALFNNAQKVADYYTSKNYRINRVSYGKQPYAFDRLSEAREVFLKNSSVIIPSTSNKSISVSPFDIENVYYRDVDKNKFFQRELANTILDTRAPMPLYDRRITPTSSMYINNFNENDPLYLDGVSMYGYDPIAVKPYNMLTPKEKKLREQRYGKPKSSKVPVKSPTKPQPKSEEIKKKEPVKEQPKPVERKQNVYEGTPVYSGTVGSGGPSALIGFSNQKGDTTFIKPEDYERFGVPKYGKEFIESRKKQRNGGVNSADAQPIEKLDQLLNFTNYNKPTKGGWLDKYKQHEKRNS